MKKGCLLLIFLVIFLVYLFLIQKDTHAALWFKYQFNPIIPTQNNQFFSKNYRDPSVLFETGKFKMWTGKISSFNNKEVIGYLESIDGINWQEINENAVVLPDEGKDFEEKSVYEPTVIKSDKYHMWYTTYDNQDIYKIRHASSIDGINWQKDQNYTLIGEKSWEDKGVRHPFVIFYNNQYYLWYAGWGKKSGNPWKLGLATSSDGVNWQKHINNPLYLPNNYGHIGGFYIELKNDKFYIYYHTGGAYAESIYYAVSTDGTSWSCPESSCLILNKTENFESTMIISPHLVRNQNQAFIYYTGYNGSRWQIGLATEKPLDSTPTPTPTPTPQPKIILIPGLFASWNKEALLHNKEVNFNQWKLPNFIHEYDGFLNSLKNLGFQKNEDFFIFTYDWRQPIEKTVEDLNKFLTNNQSSILNINFIGHSLGGLIARIFTQKYPEKVNRIISIGSPHQGAIQVYKPLSAGEIDRENTFMWLAQKLILVLNKDSFQSDRETIQKKFPVAFDLLPLFNFLKDENGQFISTNSMILKNTTLPKFNFSFPQIYSRFTAIYGKGVETPEYYSINPPNVFDNLFKNYQDGHPIFLSKNTGDGTVLTKSVYEANDNDNFSFQNFNHGEIIYKKESIKKILDILEINYTDNDVSEGKKTVISPSLIFLIQSPATLEVVDPKNNHYFEEEGIIFIENAPSGNYQILVKGKEKGNYQVIIGQIAENNDLWETIKGSITSDQPEKEIDQYQINFSSQYATYQFSTPTPTNTPSNSSNQFNQSYNSNSSSQSNSTDQSSSQTNPSLTLTPTEKFLSSNRSIPEKTSTKSSKDERKNNVLGEKTKKENTQKGGNIFTLLLIVIILLTMTAVGFYKKESIFSLISLWMKKIETKYRGR